MLVATKLMFQCMESCTSPSQCLHQLFTDQSPSIFPSQRSLWLHLNLPNMNIVNLYMDQLTIMEATRELVTVASHGIILSLYTISLTISLTILAMLVATKLMLQCMESCTSLSQCLHLLFTDQSPSIFPSQRSLWLHLNQPIMNIVKLYMDQLTIMEATRELVTVASHSIILSLYTISLPILAMLVATKLMFQCMESCTNLSQCLHLL